MPKGLRDLHFIFTEDYLTHYGGMALIQRFCRQLRLRRRLQRSVPMAKANRSYSPADLFLSLMYAIIAGLRHINKTEILQYNGAFRALLGLDQFPDQSTWRRFLKRLPVSAILQLVRVHDQLRQQSFFLLQPLSSLTFDLDNVILTIYSHQQGARLGYNPKKRGRRCYHPIFCFEAHLQEFWPGSLRPGNAGVSIGVVFFVRRCLAKAPPKMARSRIRFRADAGFYGYRLISYLEGVGCGYAIVARLHPSLKARAQQCRFHRMTPDWEVGEFR